jgi:hypothetical protein
MEQLFCGYLASDHTKLILEPFSEGATTGFCHRKSTDAKSGKADLF